MRVGMTGAVLLLLGQNRLVPKGSRAVVRAILFTDVVDSTRIARDLGDERWGELLRRERQVIRAALKQFGGREVDTAGDGLFALFESPAAGVRCAFASVEQVQHLGLDIRAGLHFGEIEMSGRGAHGIVVHTGARVMSMAGAAQVLVTSTVKDLIAGARLSLAERGAFELKGVPGRWALYDVVQLEDRPRPSPLEEPDARARREAIRPTPVRARPLPLVAAGTVLVAVLAIVLVLLLRHRPTYLPAVNTVARIDPKTGTFDRPIPVGSYPAGITYGLGRLWVIDRQSQSVDRIDPGTGARATRGTEGTPTGVAAGLGSVWVTNAFGAGGGAVSPVSKMDPGTLQFASSFEVPPGSASIAVGAGAIWVADQYGGRVIRFDPVTGTRQQVSLSTSKGSNPGVQPSFVTVGRTPPEYVWVADPLDTSIYRIDPSAGPASHPQTLQIAGHPTEIAATDTTVWVTSEQDNRLFALDAKSGATRTTVGLNGAGCRGPRGVAVGSGGVWVACTLSRELVEVSTSSLRIIGTLPVAGSPDAVTADGSGAVWVAVHAR
jgi:class 3 adenylate cyclase/streptogramin lyase